MSQEDEKDRSPAGELEDDRVPEHGSELEREPAWERGQQGRPRHGGGDPGPSGTDQAPAEFADDEGGPPPGDPVSDEDRPEPASTRQPPLVGSGERPAAHGDRDDASGGAKP